MIKVVAFEIGETGKEAAIRRRRVHNAKEVICTIRKNVVQYEQSDKNVDIFYRLANRPINQFRKSMKLLIAVRSSTVGAGFA